jgi:hypothetical protein
MWSFLKPILFFGMVMLLLVLMGYLFIQQWLHDRLDNRLISKEHNEEHDIQLVDPADNNELSDTSEEDDEDYGYIAE